MAGWNGLTPSAQDPGTGNAYLYEDTGALKYRGTSGSTATIVNADGTMSGGSSFGGWTGFNAMFSGYYYHSAIGTVGTTTATLGEMRYTPFYVPHSVTITRIGARVATSAGGATFRLGIYDSDALDQPSSLVIDAGTIDCSSTGSKSITISQTLSAGLYWLVGAGQGAAAPGIRGFVTSQYTHYVPSGTVSAGIAANPPTGWRQTGVTGAFPSTATLDQTWYNTFTIHIGV